MWLDLAFLYNLWLSITVFRPLTFTVILIWLNLDLSFYSWFYVCHFWVLLLCSPFPALFSLSCSPLNKLNLYPLTFLQNLVLVVSLGIKLLLLTESYYFIISRTEVLKPCKHGLPLFTDIYVTVSSLLYLYLMPHQTILPFFSFNSHAYVKGFQRIKPDF